MASIEILPLIREGNKVTFSWKQDVEEEFVKDSTFFYDFHQIDIKAIPNAYFYNILFGIMFPSWRNMGDIEIVSTENLPYEIFHLWKKYTNATNIVLKSGTEPTPKLKLLQENEIGLLFGGGKDSMMGLGVLSEIYPDKSIKLLSFLHPQSLGTDFKEKLLKRRQNLVLDHVEHLRNCEVVLIETDYLGKCLNQDAKNAPHITFYTSTFPILSSTLGITEFVFNYEIPHYWTNKKDNVEYTPFFKSSRPEFIDFLSTQFSNLQNNEINITNMGAPTGINTHYKIVQKRYPDLFPYTLTCETILDMNKRFCLKCNKCFYYFLYTNSVGESDEEFDNEKFLSGPYFEERLNNLFEDKQKPSINENGIFLAGPLGIIEQIDMEYWLYHLKLDELNVSPRAKLNIAKVKEYMGNVNHPHPEQYFLDAANHFPDWLYVPWENIVSSYATRKNKPVEYLFNGEYVEFDFSKNFLEDTGE
jgi:hypothetical protein